MVKKCRKCLEVKTLTEMKTNKSCRDGVENTCKKCDYKRRNKHRKDKPDMARNSYYKRTYGIDFKQYTTMLESQDHRCKICKTHSDDINHHLFVDHCHTTGAVRGLLCTHCNSLLGKAFDKVSILESAIDYLNKHKKRKK